MTTYVLSLVAEGRDNASGPLGRVSGALSAMGSVAGGILGAGALLAIGRQILDFGTNALAATAEIQAFEMGLTTLVAKELKSADATLGMNKALDMAAPLAGKLADQLRDIAIISPYELGTVQDTFRLAMAFGFSSAEATSFTKSILNMAAGVGANNEMLGRMSYNLAQIRLQGKVTAMDIRQLAMAGFDLNAVLKSVGDQFGVTIKDHNDFNKAIADGKITWEQFTLGFEKYANENFGGAADRMSRTLMGLKSTFSDFFKLTMPKLLGPAAEVVTKYLNKILNKFIELSDSGKLDEWGKSFGGVVQQVMTDAKKIFDFVAYAIDSIQTLGLQDGLFGENSPIKLALRGMFHIEVGDIMSGLQTVAQTVLGGLAVVFSAGVVGPYLAGVFGRAFAIAGMILPGSIGKFLSPFLTALGKVPVFSALFGGLGKFAGFAKLISPILGVFSGLASFALPIMLLAGAVLSVIGAFMLFKSGDLASMLTPLGDSIQRVKDTFVNMLPFLNDVGGSLMGRIGAAATELASNVIPWLVEQFDKISIWFQDNAPLIERFVQTIADGFTNIFLPAVVSLWGVVGPLLTGIVDLVLGVATLIMQVATGDWAGAWETIKTTVTNVATAIWGAVVGFLEMIAGAMGTSLAELGAVWSSNWNQLVEILGKVWQIITNTVSAYVSSLVANIGIWLAGVAATVSTIFGNVKTTITSIWEGIKTSIIVILNGMLTGIGDILKAIRMSFYMTGQMAMGQFKTAIENGVQTAIDAVKTAINKILAVIKPIVIPISFGSPGNAPTGGGTSNNNKGGSGGGSNSGGSYNPYGGGYAKGGISKGSRSGHLELLHGEEAVIPLEGGSVPVKLNNNSSRGDTYIYLTVEGAGDPEAVARNIMRMLKSQGLAAA